MTRVKGGEPRKHPVTVVLREIQAEVRRHFAGSGKTVDGFLAECREEAARQQRAECVHDGFAVRGTGQAD